MASNMQGMDTDHAREVSGQMGSHAGAVAGVCSALLQRFSAAGFVGPDRERILGDIEGSFLPNANAACESINEQATYLRSKADEQDAASS
ncbi:hypothetical protein [Nocardioides litoris]|uniref:hypothetical protein n=1 Tax=Nocardioides litoris TaxID=1926648 RepID=UPI001123BD9D|nr:hypothetical protein [Nocardioides litoris]